MASNQLEVAALGRPFSEDFSGSDPDPEKITDRRVLMNYAWDLTLDPNTVNNYLVLSDGKKQNVKHGSIDYQYPDKKERFEAQPQVLCREDLSQHHYWEVDLDSPTNTIDILVAAAYNTIERKGTGLGSKFGGNSVSWALRQINSGEKRSFSAWHDGKEGQISFEPYDGSSTLGVYLDWPAGTLSFYTVSANTVKHIYTFHTTFTEPLYPGFLVAYDGNSANLRPLQ